MTDLRSLSDDDLMRMLQAPPTAPGPDVRSLSDDDLLRALGRPARPAPGMVEDVAKSAVGGLGRGVTNIVGSTGDMRDLVGSALDWTVRQGGELLGFDMPSADEQAARFARSEAVRSQRPLGRVLEAIEAPTTAEVRNAASGAGIEFYEPQTTAGRYVSTAAEFVPAVIASRGLSLAPGAARSAAPATAGLAGDIARFGIAPGLASEAAGQATEGTAFEPYARTGAALAAGGVAALARRPGTAEASVRDAAGNLTAENVRQAQALMNQAEQIGAPITFAEAVQQVTNGATRLGSLQRVVEQSRGGAEPMAAFMAGRPAAVQRAGNAAIDAIGPIPANPSMVAADVQRAAEGIIGDAMQARTTATQGFYRAAAGDQVDPSRIATMLDDIDAAIAGDRTGILSGPLGELRDRLTASPATPGTPAQRIPRQTPAGATIYQTVPATPGAPRVPVTDVESLSRARKFFRDRTELPQFAERAIDKETAGRIGPVLDRLDAEMTAVSPGYAQGNAAYQDFTRRVVDPLQQSPIGKLMARSEFADQARIILDPNPVPGSAAEVANAVRLIRQRAPDSARALVSQRIRQVFNEATQTNAGGPNQWGGAKFNATIRGNSQQAENLRAVVDALHGPGAYDGFARTLDVFEAMGRRQPAGSQTEFNRQITEELKRGGILGEATSLAASPASLASKARDIYEGWRYGRNTDQLAAFLTRPDAATHFARIARLEPNSPRARAIAAALLVHTSVQSGGKPANPPK